MNKAESKGAESRSDIFAYDPETLTIVNEPGHPLYQKTRANLPPDERLIAAMMEYGFKDPIIVRLNGTGEDSRPIVEVVDGRQRVKAACEANRRLVEAGRPTLRVLATVERGNSDDAVATMHMTNAIRVQDDPITHAKDIKSFLDSGRSEAEARVVFGMTSRSLKAHLDLLSCSPKLQKAVEQERVSLTVARSLAALPEAEQNGKLEELEVAGLTGKKRNAAATRKVQDEVAASKGKAVVRLRRPSEVVALKKAIQKSDWGKGPTASVVLATLAWVMGKDAALKDTLPDEVVL